MTGPGYTVLNPKSYDGARVLEASGRPLLVKGRSYVEVVIQCVGEAEKTTGCVTKLTDETTEYQYSQQRQNYQVRQKHKIRIRSRNEIYDITWW